MTTQIRLRKSDVLGQQKTHGEGDAKRDHKGCDMRTNRNKAKMEYLFVKNEIIADEIQQKIQEHVSTSANKVQKRLAR